MALLARTDPEQKPAPDQRARTPTENEVLAIWCAVLKRSSVGVHDDFYDVGGHSLLAINLFDAMNRHFGVSLPLSTLLECATVAALSTRIDALKSGHSTPSARGSVVPLHAGGTLPALFWIPGLAGTPLDVKQLAQRLGADQPVYGLPYRGADGEGAPHETVSEMALHFASALQQARPTGPYYLGGFSAGGVVAFEVARLLVERGERVPLLILLDAFNPKGARWSWYERPGVLTKRVSSEGLASTLKQTAHTLRLRLGVRAKTDAPEAGGIKDHQRKVEQASFTALEHYEPRPYAGDALLIRSAPEFGYYVAYKTHESNGWRDLIKGRLEVLSLDVSHYQLLNEASARVGAIIRNALAGTRS